MPSSMDWTTTRSPPHTTESTKNYDIDKIQALKQIYEANIAFIRSNLPKINWDSRIKLKLFFSHYLDISLKNATISHIESHLQNIDHDDERYEIIVGILAYLKLKYAMKNYILHIIKNNGSVQLVKKNGEWLQSNHRPPSKAPEIVACELQGE